MRELLIFLFVFFISLTSALSIRTFAQGSNVELIQASVGATSCNITSARYPDSSIIISNVTMSQTGIEFNYTLNGTYTQRLGTNTVYGVCGNGTDSIAWSYDFEITPQGWTSTSTFYFIFLIIIALVFALGVNLKNNYIMFFGSFLVLLLGFFVIFNGVDVIKSTETTRALGIILWGISIVGIYLSVEGWLAEGGSVFR